MDFGSGFLFVAAIAVLTAYAAFQQFLRHQRRMMIHRERLAALEKGIELPPLEQEILRGRWNVQRILLFAGLVWISLGVSIYLVLNALIGQTFHFNWGLDRFRQSGVGRRSGSRRNAVDWPRVPRYRAVASDCARAGRAGALGACLS